MTKHERVEEVEVVEVELAVCRPERDRWPDQPPEADEPDQDEREREWALFNSPDRSARGDGGWSTRIERQADDGA